MTLSASGGRPTINSDANLVVQIREDLYGTNLWLAANTTPRMVSRGLKYDAIDQPTMFTANTLTGGVFVAGRRIVQGDSNGGIVAVRRGGTACVPLSQQFSGAGSLSGIMLGRPLYQYLYQVPLRLTLQAAGGRFEMCLSDSDSGIIATGTRNGPSWGVDTTVNGGRWTPFYRQLNAGALTTGPDTGLSPLNTFHLLGIRYTEGITPRIEWLMDGVPVFTVSGDANMPVYAGGATLEPGWLPAYMMSAHVGSRMQSGNALYEVRSIG